jgi:hypothetical protein
MGKQTIKKKITSIGKNKLEAATMVENFVGADEKLG